ncbi:glycosyltransferase [Desulfoluna spongiiphila]|uniref:glycosyltransferase n=1 Tax=Desulfoluna spongiiphila TaxID=419481 RepID=UPI00125AEC6B|nr:glycosyltransferase [Desulfoluna spongiiphila]VVS94874.1 glycosyl transferase family 1 [Desulfoluna spongiiphila]
MNKLIDCRILHIITDLNGFGGTEATLYRYLKCSKIPLENQIVVVLKTAGIGDTLGAQIRKLGVDLIECNQSNLFNFWQTFIKLKRVIAEFRPSTLSCWLYHPCLFSCLFKFSLPQRTRIIWHIRSLPFVTFRSHPSRFIIQRTLAALSKLPDAIISNSFMARDTHKQICYSTKNWQIIPNGLSTTVYCPNQNDRDSVREELCIPSDAIVIICVGRYAREKGYPVLFEAIRILFSRLSPCLIDNIVLVACGHNVTLDNLEIKKEFDQKFTEKNVRLLGKRADIPRLLRSADMSVSPSLSESFPNAVLEAMASKLACIATDVGDVRRILNNSDWVVEADDSHHIADKFETMISMSKEERIGIGERNRERVNTHYLLETMVDNFDKIHI